MARTKMTRALRGALIADIVGARHDVSALATRHQMSPDALAAFANDHANRAVLTGLCVLADLQTQVLLSRYRLLAATRLIKLATSESEVGEDLARKACVDLLRLDLPRAGEAAAPSETNPPEGDDASLRRVLYSQIKQLETEKS